MRFFICKESYYDGGQHQFTKGSIYVGDYHNLEKTIVEVTKDDLGKENGWVADKFEEIELSPITPDTSVLHGTQVICLCSSPSLIAGRIYKVSGNYNAGECMSVVDEKGNLSTRFKSRFAFCPTERIQKIINPNPFMVGDYVSAFGCSGRVIDITNHTHTPVVVRFTDSDRKVSFKLDGKLCSWHDTPSLILVKRPVKKKVIKTLYTGAMKHGADFRLGNSLLENKDQAESFFTSGNGYNLGVATVQVTVEMEE